MEFKGNAIQKKEKMVYAVNPQGPQESLTPK